MNYVVPLISFAIALQSVEHLLICRSTRDLDPWAWRKFPEWFYPIMLWVRLAAAAAGMIYPAMPAIYIMLLTTFFIAVRFRGTFNGGSDAMTFHILLAVAFAKLFPQHTEYAITYIAVFAACSYFFAGLGKLNSRAWRKGEALPRFLLYSNAAFPNRFAKMLIGAGGAGSAKLIALVSVAVIVFEILFPLALFSGEAMLFFLPVGILFHVANYYFFGLNRFFFAWLAAYPAIYLLVTHPALK